jgi:aryl carrier-like protein
VLRFDGRERLDRFLAALQRVVDRHDIYRTSLAWEGLREPVQVVWRRAELPVREVELEPPAVPGDGPDDVLQDAVAGLLAVAGARIDPRRAPLLAVHVAAEPGSGRWLALLHIHHLVQDHVGMEVVVAEVQAMLRGEDDRLPEPLPFRDFVARARLGVPREEHERYFAELLGDVTEPTAPFGLLDIFGDGSGVTGAQMMLAPEVAERLRAAAQLLGTSPATLFHLVWARVLAAVSGRDDVVFGTVLSGRMDAGAGADRAVGLFINTLPVRADAGQLSIAGAVEAMRRQLAGLLAHEHAPLALAQQASGVPTPFPLFTSVLNYRHSPAPAAAGGNGDGDPGDGGPGDGGLAGIEMLYARDYNNYPLSVAADDTGTAIIFGVQAVAPADPRLVCHLVQNAAAGLVTALETAPDTPLRKVEVLTRAQRRQIASWEPATVPPELDGRLVPAPDGPEAPVSAPGWQEQIVCNVFADVLGAATVEPDDSFFALGGRSLQAVAAAERLRQQGIGVSLRTLFRFPTAAALLRAIRLPGEGARGNKS